MKLNNAVEPTETDNKPAQLHKLIEGGDRAEALALAKEMQAKARAEQEGDRKSHALKLIEQSELGKPTDLEGIIGALEIELVEPVGSRSISEINDPFPKSIIAARGLSGAVLTEGNICMLSGEGGIAKSALTCSMALGFAMLEPDIKQSLQDMRGSLFGGSGGNVLMVTFEDAPGVTAWRLRELARQWDIDGEVLKNRLFLLAMENPIFGPGADGGNLYNARPEPLAGWEILWREAERRNARLDYH